MFNCCIWSCDNPCHINKIFFSFICISRDNLLPLNKYINMKYTIYDNFKYNLDNEFDKLYQSIYFKIQKKISNHKILIQGYNSWTKQWQSLQYLLEYINLLNIDYCKKCGKKYINFIYPEYYINLRFCRQEYSHLLQDNN